MDFNNEATKINTLAAQLQSAIRGGQDPKPEGNTVGAGSSFGQQFSFANTGGGGGGGAVGGGAGGIGRGNWPSGAGGGTALQQALAAHNNGASLFGAGSGPTLSSDSSSTTGTFGLSAGGSYRPQSNFSQLSQALGSSGGSSFLGGGGASSSQIQKMHDQLQALPPEQQERIFKICQQSAPRESPLNLGPRSLSVSSSIGRGSSMQQASSSTHPFPMFSNFSGANNTASSLYNTLSSQTNSLSSLGGTNTSSIGLGGKMSSPPTTAKEAKKGKRTSKKEKKDKKDKKDKKSKKKDKKDRKSKKKDKKERRKRKRDGDEPSSKRRSKKRKQAAEPKNATTPKGTTVTPKSSTSSTSKKKAKTKSSAASRKEEAARREQQRREAEQHELIFQYRVKVAARRDLTRALNPDYNNPFVSIQDFKDRLLCYHMLNDSLEEKKVIDADTRIRAAVKRAATFVHKYNSLAAQMKNAGNDSLPELNLVNRICKEEEESHFEEERAELVMIFTRKQAYMRHQVQQQHHEAKQQLKREAEERQQRQLQQQQQEAHQQHQSPSSDHDSPLQEHAMGSMASPFAGEMGMNRDGDGRGINPNSIGLQPFSASSMDFSKF